MQLGNSHRVEGGRRIRGDVRPKPPMVSIIVVLFRAREECIRLLKNIFEFDSYDFELIVIDGGSQDGTVELLKQWDDKIEYWLSEPDSGIYDAMNKGISAARGEYILHLNAGDTLQLIPYETLATCANESVDVAAFAVMTYPGGIFLPKTGFPLHVVNTWHHQGTFYRRTPELVYDIRYKIYADFDLNQRMLKKKKRVRLFYEIVSHHRRDGISQSGQNNHEIYRSIYENFGTSYVVLGFLWPHYQALRRVTKRSLVYLLSLAGKDWK